MGEEKERKHRCSCCWRYKAFYIKQDTCFKRLTIGNCNDCGQIKDHNETCESWRSKPKYRYGVRRNTVRTIREVLFQLSALRQILQEEKDAEEQ